MINITARHFELTEELKSFIEDKTARLIHHFDRIRRIDVILNFTKRIYESEVIAKGPRHVTMVAHSAERNLVNTLDMVFEKMEKQLSREKNKIKGHHGKGFKSVLKDQKKTKLKDSNEFSQNDWY
jgi:putative sigma-54 modulation protein